MRLEDRRVGQSMPAAGQVVSVGGFAPREEVQALAVVGACHQSGIALGALQASAHALGPPRNALVQCQLQEALCILHLPNDARHSVCYQIDHLHISLTQCCRKSNFLLPSTR